MKKIVSILVLLSFALPVFAHTDYKNETGSQHATTYLSYKDQSAIHNTDWSSSRFSVGAYGGYGVISGAYNQDGQVAQGHLALGLHIADYSMVNVGAEAGVQSGNSMRLSASPSIIAATGGLPIQSTLKPLVDLLVTLQGQLCQRYPLFGMVKGGIAYRHLTLDGRTSTRDNVRKVNGEFQVGLAWHVTNQFAIAGFYQGIYAASNAGIGINSAGDVTISRIPTQQAGFIGFNYFI